MKVLEKICLYIRKDLKAVMVVITIVMSLGSLFHSVGPATPKALLRTTII